MNEQEPSGKPSGPCYLDLSLRTFLGRLADASPAPAGGAAAALGVALAASLCAMTARVSRRQLPGAGQEGRRVRRDHLVVPGLDDRVGRPGDGLAARVQVGQEGRARRRNDSRDAFVNPRQNH